MESRSHEINIDDWFNEETINFIYDPDNDFSYSIRKEYQAKLGPKGFQRELVIGHLEGGNLAALKWMKKNNYSFDVLDDNDLTPLMIAAKRGYEEIVLWLLSTNIDLNKVNIKGETAYSIALKNNHQDIANHIAESAVSLMQKQLDHDPSFLQIKNSSAFKENITALNKMLNGDNPYSTKLVMKEDHKKIVIMMELFQNGNKELNISANPNSIRTNMLFDGLVADNCLFTMIVKIKFLLGNVKNSNAYFDLHSDLNAKDKKIKEMISLRKKIADFGYPHIAFYLLKEHLKQQNLNTDMLDSLAIQKPHQSHLTKLSITRSMSMDNLNKRIKSETDHKMTNLLGYFNLRNSR